MERDRRKKNDWSTSRERLSRDTGGFYPMTQDGIIGRSRQDGVIDEVQMRFKRPA